MRKKSIKLFALRILKTASSIAILSLSAHYFGVSVERDIWIIAFTSILVLDLAIWGPLNQTFRTKFIFIKEQEGEAIALKKTASLMNAILVISLMLAVIILLFPQPLARIIAPGYYNSHYDVLIFMIRIMAPSLLINQVIQLTTGVLNAYNSFYMPEIAGLISSFLNILLLVVLAPVFGIYSLVFAYYLSLLLLFALVIIQVKKLNIPLQGISPAGFSLADTWPFVIFSLPFFLPFFAGQVNAVGEKSIANLIGAGTVSVIDYSRKFIDIPVNALYSVLATMLLPVLSGFFSTKQDERFVSEFKRVLQLGLLALTVILGILILNATPIVSILYGSKKISDSQLSLMSTLVQLYSLSGFSIFLYGICGIGLIASNRGKTFAFFGIVAQVVMLAMNLLLYKPLGVYIFPVSLFFSHFIAALFLFSRLPVGRPQLLTTLLRYSFILIITILVSFFVKNFINLSASPYMDIIINSVMLVVFGVLVSFLMRIEEKGFVIKLMKKTKPMAV